LRKVAGSEHFVLDNSVSAAWCFEDQSTDYTDGILQAVIDGSQVIVPAVWRLEVVNALVVAERRKNIAPAKSAKFLRDLEKFNITVDIAGLDHVFTRVLDQARLYQRSAYDASYLELAERRGLPIATKDEPLRKAAEQLGLRIFEP
jgi:predicted nucleic acid-binding protein